MLTRRFLQALYIIAALLFAPLVIANDLTDVSYGVSDSTSYQSMQDTKACEACHVAPEVQRQKNTTEYKVKTSHVGGGSNNYPNNDGVTSNRLASYIEVGWR